jgi:hypothetical protein
MLPLIIVVLFQWAMVMTVPPLVGPVIDRLAQCIPSLGAPSPIADIIPSSALASTVTFANDSVPVSLFHSADWFSPSATATATATSTPTFATSDIPAPVTIEALAPGLPVYESLCIAFLVLLVLFSLLWYAYQLGQVKGAKHPVHPPEEATLSCSDSIATRTYYGWHDSNSKHSA